MQVKTVELLDAVGSLRELTEMPLPVRVSMQVRRVVRTVGPIVDDYNAERAKLVQQFAAPGAVPDERGQIALADGAGFNAAVRELLDLEHEIGEGLSVEPLADSGVTVLPRVLIGLGPLLVE